MLFYAGFALFYAILMLEMMKLIGITTRPRLTTTAHAAKAAQT